MQGINQIAAVVKNLVRLNVKSGIYVRVITIAINGISSVVLKKV